MPDYDGIPALDRMECAVEKVRNRLLRSTAALEATGIPYAVIGGNAVMAWMEQVDESAVRFTPDVDIVLSREDLGRAAEAMALAGFVHRQVAGIDMFLDGPNAKPRDAVRVIFVRGGGAAGILHCRAGRPRERVFQIVSDALARVARADEAHLVSTQRQGASDRHAGRVENLLRGRAHDGNVINSLSLERHFS
jgi:hypothetical protein